MNLDFEAAVLNVSLLVAITAPHEFAHAWLADKLGDDTPRQDGRVTLYPPAHIDMFGTVILPALMSLFGGGFLGWGRPVRTDPRKLRYGLNGLAMVALAGPAMNIIFAAVLAAAAMFLRYKLPVAAEWAAHGVRLSIYLAIFNMIPVPPLDGSKLLLAARIPVAVYNELARFGFMLLIVAVSFSDIGLYMSRWSDIGTFLLLSLFR